MCESKTKIFPPHDEKEGRPQTSPLTDLVQSNRWTSVGHLSSNNLFVELFRGFLEKALLSIFDQLPRFQHTPRSSDWQKHNREWSWTLLGNSGGKIIIYNNTDKIQIESYRTVNTLGVWSTGTKGCVYKHNNHKDNQSNPTKKLCP